MKCVEKYEVLIKRGGIMIHDVAVSVKIGDQDSSMGFWIFLDGGALHYQLSYSFGKSTWFHAELKCVHVYDSLLDS